LDNDYKHRYIVKLTDDGLQYYQTVSKEETAKYYKENNLDPETSLSVLNKTKKNRVMKP
jgi:hypothetical protein